MAGLMLPSQLAALVFLKYRLHSQGQATGVGSCQSHLLAISNSHASESLHAAHKVLTGGACIIF